MSDVQGIPPEEADALILRQYRQAKRKWRRWTKKPTRTYRRHVKTFQHKSFMKKKGLRRNAMKKTPYKPGGKRRRFDCRFYVEDPDPTVAYHRYLAGKQHMWIRPPPRKGAGERGAQEAKTDKL